MALLKQLKADKLSVKIYKTRGGAGDAAGKYCAELIRKLQREKDFVNVMFAAAPSQSEMLAALTSEEDIDWGRIRAFHMDEYIGLNKDAPQCFGNFLYRELFSKVKFKEVFYINDESSPDGQCLRYRRLLEEYPADIICMGIGENGHIAFNDPHEADFNDKHTVKLVTLDEKCRRQQVNDGCFKTIDEVPKQAITVIFPYFLRARYLVCTVPAASKAEAVFNTVRGEISEKCPASVMRNHDNAVMFADRDSGKRLLFRKAVITDEISQDPETAAELAKRYNLEGVEIRSVWDTAPEDLTDGQIDRINDILKQNGLKVVSISSSIFKCRLGEDQTRKIDKTIRLAKKLGSGFIRCFSYWKDENFDENAFAGELKGYESLLKENGITMLLEFDPAVNITNGRQAASLLKKVNSPQIQAIWDPGNDIYNRPFDEIPYPDGYNILKPYIKHVHLKDAVRTGDKTAGVAFGKGEVDYIGQLSALLKDNYDGYIVMETHYKKGAEISEDLLKNPKGSAFSQMGYQSTEECLQNLDEITEKVCAGF